MNVSRGDVVILEHPFSDATGAKVRPALVVQADVRNTIRTDTIVGMITKNLLRVGHDRSQLLVNVATPEGKQTGLRVNSVAACGHLATVHEDRIRRKIGSFPVVLMRKMDNCLKVALELP
jgi:mRNA interferase MazF